MTIALSQHQPLTADGYLLFATRIVRLLAYGDAPATRHEKNLILNSSISNTLPLQSGQDTEEGDVT